LSHVGYVTRFFKRYLGCYFDLLTDPLANIEGIRGMDSEEKSIARILWLEEKEQTSQPLIETQCLVWIIGLVQLLCTSRSKNQ